MASTLASRASARSAARGRGWTSAAVAGGPSMITSRASAAWLREAAIPWRIDGLRPCRFSAALMGRGHDSGWGTPVKRAKKAASGSDCCSVPSVSRRGLHRNTDRCRRLSRRASPAHTAVRPAPLWREVTRSGVIVYRGVVSRCGYDGSGNDSTVFWVGELIRTEPLPYKGGALSYRNI